MNKIDVSSEDALSSLDGWVEHGFNKDVVAAYGTHVGVLKQILKSGNVPAMPREKMTLDYQKKLKKDGFKIYYSLPYIENLKRFDAVLATDILRKGQSCNYFDKLDEVKQYNECVLTMRKNCKDWLDNNLNGGLALKPEPELVMSDRLTNKNITEMAEFYSFCNSLVYEFEVATAVPNVDSSDIFEISKRLWPKKFKSFKANCRFLGVFEDDVYDEEKCHKLEDICRTKKVQPTWLNPDNVVIYFNYDFVKSGKPFLGVEDDDELIVGVKKELPSSVIAGVSLSTGTLAKIKKIL